MLCFEIPLFQFSCYVGIHDVGMYGVGLYGLNSNLSELHGIKFHTFKM